MRLPRVGVPRPWRWRPGRPGQRRIGTEEDARLLRRTRLRLMAVSGVVTLVILVILESAVYWIVSDRVESTARDQLTAAATRQVGTDDPYGFTIEGPTAGLIAIVVDPQGNVGVPHGLLTIPIGLPDQASLAAVNTVGQLDIRNIVLPNGTPCRILTGFSA